MNDFHFNTSFIEEYLTTLKSVKHYKYIGLNPRILRPNVVKIDNI
ncbi:hypothetical protein L3N51_01720 [Metallosphaera sp. J1]|nr:hypothetical protein [Metallosphaera javensis (ex Hofmann et al. 2022)]